MSLTWKKYFFYSFFFCFNQTHFYFWNKSYILFFSFCVKAPNISTNPSYILRLKLKVAFCVRKVFEQKSKYLDEFIITIDWTVIPKFDHQRELCVSNPREIVFPSYCKWVFKLSQFCTMSVIETTTIWTICVNNTNGKYTNMQK